MSDKGRPYTSTEIHTLFAKLNPSDVEQFYSTYQLWTAQQKIIELQAHITSLQQQKAANHELMQQALPSTIMLAALARLQSNGVTDADLLDRMLERGETWLDQTMQRLSYCEQLDFISNNYTEWCEHALDGAYDWIDSLYDNNISSDADAPASTAIIPTSTTDALGEATEELLLQKLMSDDAEDEAFMQAPTLKRSAVVPVQTVQAGVEEAEPPPPASEHQAFEPVIAIPEETQLNGLHTHTALTDDMKQPGASNEATPEVAQLNDLHTHIEPAEVTEQPDLSNDELASKASGQPSIEPLSEDADFLPPVYRPKRKRSILQRLFAMFFPSK